MIVIDAEVYHYGIKGMKWGSKKSTGSSKNNKPKKNKKKTDPSATTSSFRKKRSDRATFGDRGHICCPSVIRQGWRKGSQTKIYETDQR